MVLLDIGIICHQTLKRKIVLKSTGVQLPAGVEEAGPGEAGAGQLGPVK